MINPYSATPGTDLKEAFKPVIEELSKGDAGIYTVVVITDGEPVAPNINPLDAFTGLDLMILEGEE